MEGDPNGPLELVYAVNRTFSSFAVVSAKSVINSARDPVRFHFVHDGDLDPSDQTRIADYLGQGGNSVHFHRVPDVFPREFGTQTSWDNAALYRLALTEILPESIRRVIYLDADTLVRRPLDELGTISLDRSGFAAVVEPHSAVERLKLPPESAYLNSGVLVIDLSVWRSERTCEQLLAWVMTDPQRWVFADQDIMAVHFTDGWTRIPPEYNCTHRFFNGPSPLPLPTEDPFIIHFTGQGLKPWQSNRQHPYADEFWAIADQVREAGFEIPSRPRRRVHWYQRGPVAAYRNRRRHRRAQRHLHEQAQRQQRRERIRAADREMVRNFAPEMTVKRGPFAGLCYPQAYSHGSTLAPKLLGTYEAELQPTLERFLTKDYQLIIDIGGAEGYYAIGCALRWPEAQVIAYELQREARQAIDEMARANHVRERITIAAECLTSDLYGKRGLVICDIEGCEVELLAEPRTSDAFARSDFIIETHDPFRPGISERLHAQFAQTHTVSVIDSVVDDERPGRWKLPELAALSQARQAQVLGERRPGQMRWLVCESKQPFATRQSRTAAAA